jgi:hypothetical protein
MIKVQVIFGQEAVRHYNETGKVPGEEWLMDNGGVVDWKTFKTQEEYAAYVEGVNDADGWSDHAILKPEVVEEQTSASKELWVFLFPLEDMERNTSDDEIVAAYESDDNDDRRWPVEKLTPDEFACRINDSDFADQQQWVRFIEL